MFALASRWFLEIRILWRELMTARAVSFSRIRRSYSMSIEHVHAARSGSQVMRIAASPVKTILPIQTFVITVMTNVIKRTPDRNRTNQQFVGESMGNLNMISHPDLPVAIRLNNPLIGPAIIDSTRSEVRPESCFRVDGFGSHVFQFSTVTR